MSIHEAPAGLPDMGWGNRRVETGEARDAAVLSVLDHSELSKCGRDWLETSGQPRSRVMRGNLAPRLTATRSCRPIRSEPCRAVGKT